MATIADMFDRETGQPTPGDWYVESVNHDKHRAYVYAERKYPRSVCVAEVRCETVITDELESNARAIAAVPKLLTACKAVVAAWESGDLAAAARLCDQAVKAVEGGAA